MKDQVKSSENKDEWSTRQTAVYVTLFVLFFAGLVFWAYLFPAGSR